MSASTTVRSTRLAAMGSIVVSGTDARTFLQGQLTADMDALSPQRVLLAACNSPQGRVQAILWLIERNDAIVMLVPSSIVDATIARLRKYVLRSKVKIERGTEQLAPGTTRTAPVGDAASTPRAHIQHDGVSYITLPGHDTLTLGSETMTDPDIGIEVQWRLDDIRAGLPQVYPQTHESFVAQMLNLDLLDGISFSKGCYTGQEIIARTHYRGSIKRRMFRFAAHCTPPAPGTRIVHGEQHAGEVVDAAPTDDGCELLAVISIADADAELRLDSEPSARLMRKELPYEVPSTTST